MFTRNARGSFAQDGWAYYSYADDSKHQKIYNFSSVEAWHQNYLDVNSTSERWQLNIFKSYISELK